MPVDLGGEGSCGLSTVAPDIECAVTIEQAPAAFTGNDGAEPEILALIQL